MHFLLLEKKKKKKKLEAVRGEVVAKKLSSVYPHKWGNELYHRTVLVHHPFYEKNCLPVMENDEKWQRKWQHVHGWVWH